MEHDVEGSAAHGLGSLVCIIRGSDVMADAVFNATKQQQKCCVQCHQAAAEMLCSIPPSSSRNAVFNTTKQQQKCCVGCHQAAAEMLCWMPPSSSRNAVFNATSSRRHSGNPLVGGSA
eukprot:1138642-Pelagomonas_calceolata.AAC.3